MYQINTDGTEQLELVQGRKFAQAVNDKYLIYIDYADQESEHMINLETKEDVVIGFEEEQLTQIIDWFGA